MGTLVHLRLDRFISHLPQVLNHRCTIDLIGVFNDNTTFFPVQPELQTPRTTAPTLYESSCCNRKPLHSVPL